MKKTIIAATLFAVLLVLVLATREKNVNVGVPKLSLPPLAQDVTEVDVTGAHQAKLALTGGSWSVSNKVADEAQVKSLLENLKNFKVQDFITEKPEKLAELELDEVKGTMVTVSTAAGPQWSLVFGKASTAGGTFVREAKSKAVFTTQSPVAFQLKREIKAWRKKAIATAAADDMVKVTVTQKDGVVSLVKADGAWKLDPPPPAPFRFDPQAAQRLAQQLTSLNAQDFMDTNPGTEAATVEITLKDGKNLSLHLGVKQPDGAVPLVVENDPQTYLVPSWAAEGLLKRADDLRDTTLLAFEPEKVKEVALTTGSTTVQLVRDGAAFKVQQPRQLPAGFEFDPTLVPQQLARWKSLRAARVVSGVADAAAGLGKPSAKLELTLEGGAKQTLVFGSAAPNNELYVKGSADALLYAMAPSEKQQLERGLELFRRRPPPDPSQISGLDQLPPEIRKQLEAQFKNRGAHP